MTDPCPIHKENCHGGRTNLPVHNSLRKNSPKTLCGTVIGRVGLDDSVVELRNETSSGAGGPDPRITPAQLISGARHSVVNLRPGAGQRPADLENGGLSSAAALYKTLIHRRNSGKSQ